MKCHVHVKEKKKFKRKDNEVLISMGIYPMVFVIYKLILKMLKSNIIFISCHNYLIELVIGIKICEK